MISVLSGELELWNGARVAFTAAITPEVVDGCRVYRADLPLYLDGRGVPQLVRQVLLDVLPAHSTLALHFDPDLPATVVPTTEGDVV